MNDTDDIISDFFTQVRMVLGLAAIPESAEKEIEKRIRVTWGGQPVYVRKLDSGSKAAAVRAEFNGRNRKELQLKHGISKAQFYKYIKGG